MNKKPSKFSPEVRERAVRLVREQRDEHPSLWAAVESIAGMIGCSPQTLHEWIKRDQIDQGERAGVTTDERERLKALERENKEGTAEGQRNPEAGECVFRPSGARPPVEILKAFIDQHRNTFGVEPICKVLRIAPSGYRRMLRRFVIRQSYAPGRSEMRSSARKSAGFGRPICRSTAQSKSGSR
jgi:transposase-like protein